MGTLMGTLRERAQCADAQLLSFQEEMARRKGFEPPGPDTVKVLFGVRLLTVPSSLARAASRHSHA